MSVCYRLIGVTQVQLRCTQIYFRYARMLSFISGLIYVYFQILSFHIVFTFLAQSTCDVYIVPIFYTHATILIYFIMQVLVPTSSGDCLCNQKNQGFGDECEHLDQLVIMFVLIKHLLAFPTSAIISLGPISHNVFFSQFVSFIFVDIFFFNEDNLL